MTDEPEITAARGRLDSLPAAWLSPELEASVLRRANVAAVARLLAESAAETRARIAALRQAVCDGVWSHDGLRELVAAESDAQVTETARANLPEVTLDESAIDAAMTGAVQALAQAASDLRIPPLAFEEDRASWRRACELATRPLEPPAPTAEDLAAIEAVKGVREPLEGWFAHYDDVWAVSRVEQRATGDQLDRICAAAALLAQSETLIPRATEAREAAERANAAREAAGRWNEQSAAAAALR